MDLNQFYMTNSRYQFGPGEYQNYVRNPLNKLLYEVTQAGIGPAKISPLTPNLQIADGDGKMSAGLHHAAFIDSNGFAWAIGDVTVFGKSAANGLLNTGIGNAKQVAAYANGGDNNGNGIAVVTNDGKLILVGDTQSSFRGDGTPGNAAETAPYTVQAPITIAKIAVGGYFFALGTNGVVYRWGGSLQNSYWSQFSCGAFTANPDLTRIGRMNLPEPIQDIKGGSNWTFAEGISGKWYVWGYDSRYWGMPNSSQQLQYFDMTSFLSVVPGKIVQLEVSSLSNYVLNDAGDIYSFGDNSNGTIGNGQEGPTAAATKVGLWNGGELFVYTPTKVTPPGVKFVKIWTGVAATFYILSEDINGTLWVWGRNKGFVLWNGQGGDSQTQSSQPNKWDVLAPMQIAGFGPMAVTPPVVVPPPPPAPRTVVSVTIPVLGQDIIVPAALIKKVAFNDGSTQ